MLSDDLETIWSRICNFFSLLGTEAHYLHHPDHPRTAVDSSKENSALLQRQAAIVISGNIEGPELLGADVAYWYYSLRHES